MATVKRQPVAGVDYDPDAPMEQDDYEYFTSTGEYVGNGWSEEKEREADIEHMRRLWNGLCLNCGSANTVEIEERYSVVEQRHCGDCGTTYVAEC